MVDNMSKTYNNEIVVDFREEEVQGNKYVDFIDYVFDTMNKADAKEAMTTLVTSLANLASERKELIDEYDSLLEETQNALMEALDLLNKISNK